MFFVSWQKASFGPKRCNCLGQFTFRSYHKYIYRSEEFAFPGKEIYSKEYGSNPERLGWWFHAVNSRNIRKKRQRSSFCWTIKRLLYVTRRIHVILAVAEILTTHLQVYRILYMSSPLYSMARSDKSVPKAGPNIACTCFYARVDFVVYWSLIKLLRTGWKQWETENQHVKRKLYVCICVSVWMYAASVS